MLVLANIVIATKFFPASSGWQVLYLKFIQPYENVAHKTISLVQGTQELLYVLKTH